MTTLITKNSSTAASAPTAGSLTQGELAVNVTDKKIYTKNAGGAIILLTDINNTATLTGASFTGAITTNSTFDGRDVAADGTKLDGIESGANVTDTANVSSSGAAMRTGATFTGAIAANAGVAVAGNMYLTNTDWTTWSTIINSTAAGAFGYLQTSYQANGTEVGNIISQTNSTSYNTSSDYRLKENVGSVINACSRVQQLKPCNFDWKTNGENVDGFIAHELAEVIPEAVTGIKDYIDEEGNPRYQSIDQSKLVPLLTAALQEALVRIEALESAATP